MRIIIISAAVLAALSGLVQAQAPWCVPCGSGGTDRVSFEFKEFRPGPREHIQNAIFDVSYYSTANDGLCDEIFEYVVFRDCFQEWAQVDRTHWKHFNGCIKLCGSPSDCNPENHLCEDCFFLSHAFSTWEESIPLCGKGKLIIRFKGKEVADLPFDFGYPSGTEGWPHVTDVKLLN